MTDNAVIEAVGNLQFSVVLAWIVGIIGLLCFCFVLGMKIYKAMEKYRHGRNSMDKNKADFELLKKSDEEQKEQLKCIAFALQKILADRLNQQIEDYYYKGYIPHKEFSVFQSNFHGYESVGGNGEMHEKYLKCIEDLECK